MRITFFLYSLLIILVFVSCSQKEAILTGRVTETDSTTVIAGVSVFEKSHNHLQTTTDSIGLFKLNRVSCEEHNIYFEKNGYEATVLNFEYTGQLDHPLITRHIVMIKTTLTD